MSPNQLAQLLHQMYPCLGSGPLDSGGVRSVISKLEAGAGLATLEVVRAMACHREDARSYNRWVHTAHPGSGYSDVVLI